MKRMIENRYPHSATLFRFCKEALSLRYRGNVKVIDQDVGAILGYDPADCSHWKKGKKSIKALSTLKSLAKHLQVDEQLLVKVAIGQVNYDEALLEFSGYGSSETEVMNYTTLNNHIINNQEKKQKDKLNQSFMGLRNDKKKTIQDLSKSIIEKQNISTFPISLTEVFAIFDEISIFSDTNSSNLVSVETNKDAPNSKAVIYFQGSELTAQTRFLVVKEVFKYLYNSKHPLIRGELEDYPNESVEIQATLFAINLLVPESLLLEAIKTLDSSKDLISQLADNFGVSKALINHRIQEYLTH